ncbi:hypothetical protein AAC387_Pa01g3527 [Persea americana]
MSYVAPVFKCEETNHISTATSPPPSSHYYRYEDTPYKNGIQECQNIPLQDQTKTETETELTTMNSKGSQLSKLHLQLSGLTSSSYILAYDNGEWRL